MTGLGLRDQLAALLSSSVRDMTLWWSQLSPDWNHIKVPFYQQQTEDQDQPMISDMSLSWMMMSMSWGAWHLAVCLAGASVGVMRVITWIMAPTDHCYWPFLLPVSRSPPCLDQLGHWLLVNIPRPRVTDSARSAEICLGLVKPDSENDSVSFTPPFIHILIDYKHCLYFNFTHLQKKPKSQS